jgi:hypothetical protein
MKELPLKPEYTPLLQLVKHDDQVSHSRQTQDTAGVFVLGEAL